MTQNKPPSDGDAPSDMDAFDAWADGADLKDRDRRLALAGWSARMVHEWKIQSPPTNCGEKVCAIYGWQCHASCRECAGALPDAVCPKCRMQHFGGTPGFVCGTTVNGRQCDGILQAPPARGHSSHG